MSHANFVHLRVHTVFSLAEGAVRIPQLGTFCQENSMPAVAVTDTGNLFGAFAFSQTLSSMGVQPLIGCEFKVRYEAVASPKLFSVSEQILESDLYTLCLYSQSEEGYLNLMKLSSQYFRTGREKNIPHLTLQEICSANKDLICLTGGYSGPLAQLLLKNHPDQAGVVLQTLNESYKDRLYIELHRQSYFKEHHQVETSLLEMAKLHSLPIVATNPSYFIGEEMMPAHDALLCIASSAYISQSDRRQSSEDFALKTPKQMETLFQDLPEALENTLLIAQRCAFKVKKRKPILPPFETPLGEKEELRKQAVEGLEKRLESHVFSPQMTEEEKTALRTQYFDRLEFELNVIDQMGFNGYFLIVADFIKWSFANDIPVGPGRGSGAGSIVAWSLTITGLDPLRFGLLFERFLNPERVSMPDFDIDFCQERRDEVIRYVSTKYGENQVAQIITFGKLQARMVVRDVGRVLQMSYGQVDRLCKLIPNNPANPVTLKEAIDQEPQLKEAKQKEEAVDTLLNTAMKLEGLYRHASTHAAGVVISGRPLEELVAVYYDPRSDIPMPVTQFNMKDVESVGLVKFDFLGLKTLTVLKKAVELVRARGIEVDLEKIPLDDEATYKMLHRVDCTGVFQLESSGMKDVVGRLKPDRIEDLIALVSLYRPGPMDNIPKYIACKHGEEEPVYAHPCLEPVLKETFGIPVYQEQVMQIAQVFAGYTLGGADILRRAMGKKIKAEMDAQRQIFVDGAAQNNIPKAKALEVFEQVEKFAGYGFNKSHAAAYALVSYQTAYMKANYPVEFMAASMTYDIHNTDKLNIFKQELDRMKIPLLPPDINRSRADFSVDQTNDGISAVRYALAGIKNVGQASMEDVVLEREKNGSYASIIDFARRLDTKAINKRQLENLISAGAFDSLHSNRRQLFENIELILAQAGQIAQEKDSRQASLFGGGDQKAQLPEVRLTACDSWNRLEELQKEFDAVGFYLTSHPLQTYEEVLRKLFVTKAGRIASLLKGSENETITLAGVLISKQERMGKNGNRFAFIQMSDDTGVFEVGVFSEQLNQFRDLLVPGTMLKIDASGRLDNESIRLTARFISPLTQALGGILVPLSIKINDHAAIPKVREILESAGRGSSVVRIMVKAVDEWVTLKLPQNYNVNLGVKEKIIQIPGVVEQRHDSAA